MKLARDVENYKGVFEGETAGPVLNGRGELVTNSTEKAEVPNTSLTSVVTSTAGPQTLEAKKSMLMQARPTVSEEKLLYGLLQEFSPANR